MRATHLLLIVAAISANFLQSSTPPAEQRSSVTKPATRSADGLAKATLKTKEPPLVSPMQPVITVRGFCDEGLPQAAFSPDSCMRVITREQFEILMKVLNPDGRPVPPNARRNLAKTYADYLAVEAAVRKARMYESPEFRKWMEWTRLHAIADFYRYSLQEKYRTPGDAEVEAYYHKHLADYERVNLARILIPRENPSAPDKNMFNKRAREIANAARTRALKGDEPAQIQNDAYIALDIAAPPPTNLGNRRRADLVAEEAAELFSLKAGEVSQVETEARNYVIYKLLGKDVLPLEEVKASLAREIYQQKFKAAMKSVLDATPAEFNEEYFSSAAAASPRDPANPAPAQLR